MKTFLVIIALSTLVITSSAQLKKGSRLIGATIGSISLGTSKSSTSYSNTPTLYNSEGSAFSFNVYPTIAWFVADNLAIGGNVSLSLYSSKSTSSNTSSTTTTDSKYNSNSYGIGPIVRYYFLNRENGSPYAQAAFNYSFAPGTSKSTTSTGASSTTVTNPGSNINPQINLGYESFISKNLGLLFYIGYSYYASTTSYDYTPSTGTGYSYTSEYKNGAFQIGVGIQGHLLNAKK